jgi:hypothetical protein
MDDWPDTQVECAQMLQNVLIDRATGSTVDDGSYTLLRRDFMNDPQTKPLLPDFVRTYRDLNQFCGYIKGADGSYQRRREIIWGAFVPLLDHLEMSDRSPGEQVISDALTALNADEVSGIWAKALARRANDPEGAITTGRQLLESVCKHILDDLAVEHPLDADLPKLWSLVSHELSLSISTH